MTPQQDKALQAYIDSSRDQVFQLGKFDCFTFTNGAWAAMHGAGYADDMLGQYARLGPKGLAKLISKTYGQTDMVAAFDEYLTPVSGIPPKGALVSTGKIGRWITGNALGIAMGVTAAFVADRGLVHLPIGDIEGAWV